MSFKKFINNPLPLNFFKEISNIPRNSGDEKAISDYLVKFAQSYGLDYKRDEFLNVLIMKQGQNGGEKSKPVVLQAHMDMVYVKRPDSQHKYESSLDISTNDGVIRAIGTSLGADNGIGMSYMLAVLASREIKHPPIEALFTSGEENGLMGAAQLKDDWLTGTTLINLDGEDEGILVAGSAGAINHSLEITTTKECENPDLASYLIYVDGLKGGHSGLEIDSGRANAIKEIGRVLYDISKNIPLFLESINGGERANVIPNYCEAKIFIKKENKEYFLEQIDEWNRVLKNEFLITDSNISLHVCSYDYTKNIPICQADTKKIIYILMLHPDGVQVMNKEIKDHVQSSINLATIKTFNDHISILSSARSSIKSQKNYMSYQVKSLSELINANYTTNSDYPAWQYENESPIRKLCFEEYTRLFGLTPKIDIIHGGLEGGYFKEKYPRVDIVSLGPDIHDVHTVSEWTDIKSVSRVWDYLQNILAKI